MRNGGSQIHTGIIARSLSFVATVNIMNAVMAFMTTALYKDTGSMGHFSNVELAPGEEPVEHLPRYALSNHFISTFDATTASEGEEKDEK
jgi:hypothetical protein